MAGGAAGVDARRIVPPPRSQAGNPAAVRTRRASRPHAEKRTRILLGTKRQRAADAGAECQAVPAPIGTVAAAARAPPAPAGIAALAAPSSNAGGRRARRAMLRVLARTHADARARARDRRRGRATQARHAAGRRSGGKRARTATSWRRATAPAARAETADCRRGGRRPRRRGTRRRRISRLLHCRRRHLDQLGPTTRSPTAPRRSRSSGTGAGGDAHRRKRRHSRLARAYPAAPRRPSPRPSRRSAPQPRRWRLALDRRQFGGGAALNRRATSSSRATRDLIASGWASVAAAAAQAASTDPRGGVRRRAAAGGGGDVGGGRGRSRAPNRFARLDPAARGNYMTLDTAFFPPAARNQRQSWPLDRDLWRAEPRRGGRRRRRRRHGGGGGRPSGTPEVMHASHGISPLPVGGEGAGVAHSSRTRRRGRRRGGSSRAATPRWTLRSLEVMFAQTFTTASGARSAACALPDAQ